MDYWSISSIVLTQEAEKLGLRVEIVSKSKNLFYISSDTKEVLFKSTDFGINCARGVKMSNNKEFTYSIFKRNGIPIADTWYIEKDEMLTLEDNNFIFPVIIKPLEEDHGDGVMMNILNIQELKEKLSSSFEIYNRMIIQKQVEGREYRLLVLMGKVIVAMNLVPASVIGDGIKTIGDLINYENESNILRGNRYSKALSYIKIDKELTDFIGKKNIDLQSIPLLGKKIQLRGASNIGTGGTIVDVTDIISEDIKNTACEAAKLLGLGIAGVDIITTDITKPLEETGGIILEINETPGLGGDRELTSVNTGKVILEKIFF